MDKLQYLCVVDACKKIISNFNTVGKVQLGDKLRIVSDHWSIFNFSRQPLNYKTHYFMIEDRYLLQGIQRSYTCDGQMQMINFINILIRETNNNLSQIRQWKDDASQVVTTSSLLNKLSESIYKASKGLEILKTSTYEKNHEHLQGLKNSLDKLRDHVNVYIIQLESSCHETQ